MTDPRSACGTTNRGYRSQLDIPLRKVWAVLAVAILGPHIVFILVDDTDPRLVASTGSSSTGRSETLEDTQGSCRLVMLNEPVRSVNNGLTGLYAVLFSDAGCTEPVSVVAPGKYDSGVVETDYHAPIRGEPERSLLGRHGALSYRTVTPGNSPRDATP